MTEAAARRETVGSYWALAIHSVFGALTYFATLGQAEGGGGWLRVGTVALAAGLLAYTGIRVFGVERCLGSWVRVLVYSSGVAVLSSLVTVLGVIMLPECWANTPTAFPSGEAAAKAIVVTFMFTMFGAIAAFPWCVCAAVLTRFVVRST